MKLTVESLRQIGAFTGGAVQRQVEWLQNGELVSAEVWVRPLSYQTATTDVLALRAGESAWPRRIAMCICQEDGSPVFPQLSDITGIGDDGKPILTEDENGQMVERGGINHSLFDALVMSIVEVSGLGKMLTSSSLNQQKSSGTSSSSTASAVKRSKKQKQH